MDFKCVSADVVLVGSFGSYPFMSPEWLAEHLIKAEAGSQLNININIDSVTLEPTFTVTVNDMTIEASRRRMIVKHKTFDIASFGLIEQIVTTIADLLPHTACTAMGVNFAFSCLPTEKDRPIVKPIDTLRIDGAFRPLSISGSYQINDHETLNIDIRNPRQEGTSYSANFNFDTKIKMTGMKLPALAIAKNALIDRPISVRYQECMVILGAN